MAEEDSSVQEFTIQILKTWKLFFRKLQRSRKSTLIKFRWKWNL